MILDYMQKDSLHSYLSSASGFWYYYDLKNEDSAYIAQADDLVTLTYNLVNFRNDTLYSRDEIGILRYKVDKQALFPGLRNAVKILAENETATFLFPSSQAYGYHGNNDKIGANVPLRATLSILNIERQTENIQD